MNVSSGERTVRVNITGDINAIAIQNVIAIVYPLDQGHWDW